MKVLLDSCVAPAAADALRALGHDVVWAGDWPNDPGDPQVLTAAIAEARVLVTIDKDFGELVIVNEIRHHGLVRLVGFRAREQGAAAAAVLNAYPADLAAGAVLTVDRWRVRVRPSA